MVSCGIGVPIHNRIALVQVKIQEDGYNAALDPPWASKRLPTVNSTWPATIPAALRPGEYLLRHEILGLQRATEVGRAQFYVRRHRPVRQS